MEPSDTRSTAHASGQVVSGEGQALRNRGAPYGLSTLRIMSQLQKGRRHWCMLPRGRTLVMWCRGQEARHRRRGRVLCDSSM